MREMRVVLDVYTGRVENEKRIIETKTLLLKEETKKKECLHI